MAAGLPLLTALIGVVIGIMGITAVTGFVDMDSAVPTVALMLGLAVGIDYALFIISRHRAQLFEGMDPEESAARAVGTAGSAVVFAGATVVIALASLAVVGIPFMTAMGLAAAGTVAVAVAVSLTLVPALLGFAGMRMAKGKNFETGPRAAKPTLGARWVGLLTRHRVPAVVLSVLALGALSIPVLDMRLGQPDDSTAAPQETNRKAYDLLVDGFGPGFNGPLMLVVDAGEGGSAKVAADAVASEFGQLEDVVDVGTPVLNDAGDTAIVSLTPRSGPSTEATKDLVKQIRDRTDTLDGELGATVLVTGQTAANIDFAGRLSGALIPYLALIVGLAFLLLMIAFRSILVPLTAVGGFLLTIGATFGALVAVFQQGTFAGAVRDRADGADRLGAADLHRRHPVRARDGLPGVPGLAHARGARARGGPDPRDHRGLPARRARRHRRGADHGRGLRRLHRRGLGAHQVDRLRARVRHPDRRVRGADDADPGRDGAARRARVVAAALARATAPAEVHGTTSALTTRCAATSSSASWVCARSYSPLISSVHGNRLAYLAMTWTER